MDAYSKSKTPEGEGDKRQTPLKVYSRIQQIINIPIIHDVAAENHTTKSESFWTKEDDALKQEWNKEIEKIAKQNEFNTSYAVWMNPPYSDPETWCKKAYQESRKGLIIVGLLPDDRSTGWYQDWIEDKAPIIYVPDKRISFEDADGIAQKGNPKGSVVVLWMPMQIDRTTYMRFKL